MSQYPTKSIKIKISYKIIFDVLFSVFKKNKDVFTRNLMQECKINDEINKFESINDFYLYISNNLNRELKKKSFNQIKMEIVKKGKFKPLEDLIYVQTNVRENINFRIAEEEKLKLKQLKDKLDIFPTGVIVELMIELFISKLTEKEYILVRKVIEVECA